jgi:hypothetical protein
LIRVFLVSFVLGLLATVVVARFFPFPEPPRVYSEASALANGGREEVFLIRLPEDRLGSPRAATTSDFPQQSFSAVGKHRIMAELFRIRDAKGRVIGIASRMNGTVPDQQQGSEAATDWMLLLPGRGALVMSRAAVEVGGERKFQVDRMGFSFANSGPLIAGSGDFAELSGFYEEATDVEKIDSRGQVHGLVRLRTRLRSAAE